MAENFMKFHGGPTPILPKGSQSFGKKTTTTTPTTMKQPGHVKVAHHPGRSTKHSPPVTPHHTGMGAGLMSPVQQYGALRGNAHPPVGRIRTRTMGPEPVNPKGSQEFTGKTSTSGYSGQGKQPGHLRGHGAQAGGGQTTRPYGGAGEGGPASIQSKSTGQHSHMAAAISPRMHVGMTKKIKGLIGKKPSHPHRSPY